MHPRAVFAVLMLVLLAGGLWWVASLAPTNASSSGEFAVFVVGPSGLLANGTVQVQDADALRVLHALADLRGFDVAVDDLAGCDYDYVRGIAGHSETATGGWNFYIRRDGGDWAWQDRAASCRGLQPGDEVEWCWVEADVCRSHVT